jgi:phospholipase C
MMSVRTGALITIGLTAVISGCAGTSPSIYGAPQSLVQANTAVQPARRRARSPIKHVVIMIQENRTFNDFFATFPGADGSTTGVMAQSPGCGVPARATVSLTESNLVTPHDMNHQYPAYKIARNGGQMDGFDKVRFVNGQPECAFPYQYTNPAQIQPYWELARQYVLAEHMFTTQGSSSFTAHQDLIAGATIVAQNKAMVDLPTCSGLKCVWGCDAPKSPPTRTSLITQNDQYLLDQGPFPCSNRFKSAYPTLRDLLDAKSISWKYYVPPMNTNFGKLMSAFDVVAAVRYGPEWTTNVVTPQTQIFNDISNHSLPAVSWVIPDEPDSDHPGEKVDNGPEWVASVVNAIGGSRYWKSTAIIIVWDDWGGLFDNLVPPVKGYGYGGLGFRVPAIIVSPYAKAGYISPTQYEFASILKYIEKNWKLGSLGTSDVRANSLIDSFNYLQTPIPFTAIPSSLSKSYFIHRKPSYLPVDTDL